MTQPDTVTVPRATWDEIQRERHKLGQTLDVLAAEARALHVDADLARARGEYIVQVLKERARLLAELDELRAHHAGCNRPAERHADPRSGMGEGDRMPETAQAESEGHDG